MQKKLKITEQMVRDSGGDPNNCEEIQNIQNAMAKALDVAEKMEIFADYYCHENVKIYKPTINHRMHFQPIMELMQVSVERRMQVSAYILSFSGKDVVDAFTLGLLPNGKIGYNIDKIMKEAFKFCSERDEIVLYELVSVALQFDKIEKTMDESAKKK